MFRLPHCTPTFGGHSPLCDRNARFCFKDARHTDACTPHGSFVSTCREPEGPEDYCGNLASVCILANETGRCPEHEPAVLSPWGDIIRPDMGTWVFSFGAPGELTELYGK